MNALIEDVSASIVEHGVTPDQQTMTVEKVFWSHFSANLIPATWVLGAILVLDGLDFTSGLIAIVLGNLLGCSLVAANATIGPRTGLTQIEISRFSFGRLGTRVPSLLNWCNAVGWDAAGNVPSALALVALFGLYGVRAPFAVALVVLVSVQFVSSAYGHHIVQVLTKYLCYVLAVLFATTGIVAIMRGGSLASAHEPVHPATFVLGVALTAGAAMGFAPYAADYTRYLPRTTNPRTIFVLAFAGLATASVLLEVCGLLTAGHLTDLSTAGVIAGIGVVTGPLAPLAFFALALSTIPVNSINDNTGAYSMISAGIRLPRPVAAMLTTMCGFTVALVGAARFADVFSTYLVLALYWIAPWTGIMLTDWLLFRGEQRPASAWGSGATIFVITVPATLFFFAVAGPYTGPLAKMLGGIDIGCFVGFFVASITYGLVERPRLRERAATVAE